jgi:hypothetical protein
MGIEYNMFLEWNRIKTNRDIKIAMRREKELKWQTGGEANLVNSPQRLVTTVEDP